MERFLDAHDENFDVCRSFLAISMIVTHVFEMFLINDYNRSLTYFVTVGFVYISGLTIGAIYSQRFYEYPYKTIKKMVSRFLKLVFIYVFLNALVMVVMPWRFKEIYYWKIEKIIISVALGHANRMFGYDILIPIAFTSLFSCLTFFRYKLIYDAFFIVSSFVLMYTLNTCYKYNDYGVILLIIGLIGSLMGKLLKKFELNYICYILKNKLIVFVLLILCIYYYYLIVVVWEKCVRIWYHFLPTIILLITIYSISIKINPLIIKINKINSILSSNLLFIYIYHIAIINCLFYVIRKDSLTFIKTVNLSLALLVFVTLSCFLIDYLCKKSPFFKSLYIYIFRI